MKYSSRAIFLMKKLQRGLRQILGVQVSLRDPFVVEKLTNHADHSGVSELVTLGAEIRKEMQSHRQQDSGDTNGKDGVTVSPTSYQPLGCIDELSRAIGALLADYCGPISPFLVEQVLLTYDKPDLRVDIMTFVHKLATEISDAVAREEFIHRCQHLQ